MKIVLFSYAILPKSLYSSKGIKYNDKLDPNFSLTGLSILECYAGFITSKKIANLDKIIILGCHTFDNNNPSDSRLMSIYLQKLGTPKKKLIISENGDNTVFQIEQLVKLLNSINNNDSLIGITLEFHKKRTEKLLTTYGIKMAMFSVEEIIKKHKKIVPKKIHNLLNSFENSKTKKKLERDAKILLMMQEFDHKGYLQKLITRALGIRYFDIDIPPTKASEIIQ